MCTEPLRGFPNGVTKNGKTNYIITSSNINHVEITDSGSINRCRDSFVSSNCQRAIFEYIEVPCGQCLECRLEYSRQWANRCMLEASLYKENCFITLTYNDLNIPTNEGVNSITGEITKFKTLKKQDFQLFMKRLRKELNKDDIKIRFFACGEYGDETKRPHYHAIIFGWKPNENDLQLVKTSELGHPYYSSKILEKVWPYGFNLVADCTWETCAYVARYVVKKVNISNDIYDDNNIEREFILMSRRPGIGLDWFTQNNVCYATFLESYIPTTNGNRKISHNKYFDSKLEKIDPVLFENMKETRKYFQRHRKKMINRSSDKEYLEILNDKARALENRTKVLTRKEI